MVVKDVLDVLSDADAYVPLGVDNQYQYVLFYSPKDRTTKVAVLSLDMSALVSVWENNFRLPDSLPRVTGKQKRLAKSKSLHHFFLRFPETEKKRTQKKAAPRIFTTTIIVYENEKAVQEVVGAEVSSTLTQLSKNVVYEANKQLLRKIVAIVSNHTAGTTTNVRYEVFVSSVDVPRITRLYQYTHEVLAVRFKAATP